MSQLHISGSTIDLALSIQCESKTKLWFNRGPIRLAAKHRYTCFFKEHRPIFLFGLGHRQILHQHRISTNSARRNLCHAEMSPFLCTLIRTLMKWFTKPVCANKCSYLITDTIAKMSTAISKCDTFRRTMCILESYEEIEARKLEEIVKNCVFPYICVSVS